MNRKLIKIAAIVVILALSIPMIVTAASNNGDILSFISKKDSDLKYGSEADEITMDLDVAYKTDELERLPEEDFNIRGRWGIYNSKNEGTFKGLEDQNTICGKTLFDNEKIYFYVQMNKYSQTFKGVVIYKDNFYTLNGNYLKKDGKFIALWTTENKEGWIAGELLQYD